MTTTREQFYQVRRAHREMRSALKLQCASASRMAFRAAIMRMAPISLPIDVARAAVESIIPGHDWFPSLTQAIERQQRRALSLASRANACA
ncbi:hypothetical protein [Paraburkholderia kururiensis]|uniref:hypothetical protein n=1 Tax=Paraburkholderia kururiensis TaxID=984307 RepID=UPI0005AAB916|nr:hypothetical protein [Paraburkholderia kururiensis]